MLEGGEMVENGQKCAKKQENMRRKIKGKARWMNGYGEKPEPRIIINIQNTTGFSNQQLFF